MLGAKRIFHIILICTFVWIHRGYGCAHPYFPGVFSRVSYFADFIKMTICDISTNPPPEYDCDNVVALPSEENSVPITVIIQLDDHPAETSWSILRKETDTILVNVIEGTYATAQAQTRETVYLPPGSNNYFQIFDGHGDGLCCDTPVSTSAWRIMHRWMDRFGNRCSRHNSFISFIGQLSGCTWKR